MDISTLNLEEYDEKQQEALRLLKRVYGDNVPDDILDQVTGIGE
jgi:hypothetical protein